MVQEQLIARGISDTSVLSTFRNIPRHLFVEKEHRNRAYEDHPVSIGFEQTISQPYIVALMTQSLELKETDRVLEIGTGSGYQSAILAELAKEVYTVERINELSVNAQEILSKQEYKNIKFNVGDGSLGWEEYSPFDKVIVTAAAPDIPAPLLRQLNDNGIMIIPIGEKSRQELTLVHKKKGAIKTSILCGCVFVKLLGENGWMK